MEQTAAPEVMQQAAGAATTPQNLALAVWHGILWGLLTAVVLVNAWGFRYYLSPLSARLRHPLHASLKPAGLVGQTFGILALALFLFLWLYPLRKRIPWLSRTGSVAAWLNFHIVAGLTVPFVAATHAGWRFSGLVGLAYIAMFIVFLSGLVGRYLYGRIPRHRDGLALSRDEAAAERERLLFELVATTGLPPSDVRRLLSPDTTTQAGPSLLGVLRRMVLDDLRRQRAARAFADELRHRPETAQLDGTHLAQALSLARREMALDQQVRLLDAARRLFKWWHAAHQPFAIAALLGVIAHVVVAISVGEAWLR